MSYDAAIDFAVESTGIPDGMMALDIGIRSRSLHVIIWLIWILILFFDWIRNAFLFFTFEMYREVFTGVIHEASTIIWNGPMGAYEFGKFAAGNIFSFILTLVLSLCYFVIFYILLFCLSLFLRNQSGYGFFGGSCNCRSPFPILTFPRFFFLSSCREHCHCVWEWHMRSLQGLSRNIPSLYIFIYIMLHSYVFPSKIWGTEDKITHMSTGDSVRLEKRKCVNEYVNVRGCENERKRW